ncbi:MAG: hypothetical protein NC311_10690 [Muribaculaceae bacterium]|nr:hypothetical protein [Muribaculaceae bacterium]
MDIFEMLDEKFDLYEQINELNEMLFQEGVFYASYHQYTFCQTFDDVLFRGWKYSKGRLSIRNIIDELGLNNEVGTEEVAYLSLQFDTNILSYAEKNIKALCKDYTLIRKNFFQEAANKLSYILDKAGLKAIRHNTEEYYLIVPRDEKVKTVAESVDKDSAFLLYEYTSPVLKDNVKEKRRILKLLTNNYEALIKEYVSKYNSGLIHNILQDLSTILNNFELRHPNLNPATPEYFKPNLTTYSTAQWIEIYDTAYQLMLTVSMIKNYNDELTVLVNRHKVNL